MQKSVTHSLSLIDYSISLSNPLFSPEMVKLSIRIRFFSLSLSLSQRLFLHSNAMLVSNHEDLSQLVIKPPIVLSASSDEKSLKEQATVQLALTLDSIWHMRNVQAVH